MSTIRSRGSYIVYSKCAGRMHLSEGLGVGYSTSRHSNISISLLITSIILLGAISTEVIHFLTDNHSKVVSVRG